MAAARSPINVTATHEVSQQHSPWHSPVPYLFGGLASMLGLIAFALLILACSYWKLSGYLENGNEGDRDLEAGREDGDKAKVEKQQNGVVFEEKILVIMAGEVKPTFLATPMTGRSSSFGDENSTKSCSCTENTEKTKENDVVTQESGDQEQSGRLETTTSALELSNQTR